MTASRSRAASTPAATPPPAEPSNQDAINHLIALRNALNEMYWRATQLKDKELIHDEIVAVITEIDRLDAAGIEELGKRYQPALDVKASINALTAIRQKLHTIIIDITVAAQVAQALLQAATFLAAVA